MYSTTEKINVNIIHELIPIRIYSIFQLGNINVNATKIIHNIKLKAIKKNITGSLLYTS
jgi:hypothetical protein